jgi:HlyD family secretion protein
VKKWFILLGLSTLLLLVGFQFLYFGKAKPKTVETARVTPGDIVEYVKGTGRVEAVEDAAVHAREAMRIEKVLVEESDNVEAGQELLRIDVAEKTDAVKKARLRLQQSKIAVEETKSKLDGSERTYSDPSELEQNLRAKESNYEQAVIEKRRAEREAKTAFELYGAGAESLLSLKAKEDKLKEAEVRLLRVKQELDEAKELFSKKEKTNMNLAALRAEYERAVRQEDLSKAELDMAISLLERLKITSPIRGTVVSIGVKEGMFVPAGQRILTVADLERLQVRTDIDEIDAGKIRENQDAIITFEAFPEKAFHGHVVKIAPQAEIKKDRTVVETLILLDEGTDLLKISNQVDVKIVVERRHDVLRVPLNAVHQDSSPFVWLYQDGSARRVGVRTGLSDLDLVEIVDGLKDGNEVIMTRGMTLTDGEAVRKQ